MIYPMFLVYQVICVAFFCLAFFFKQEMLWILTLLTSAMLMFSSYGIEVGDKTVSYPFLMGFNLVLFLIGLVLVIFDMFEKYGHKINERDN